MTTTAFKIGKTYNVHLGNLILTYLNEIYFYGRATVSGSNTHWHTGTIRSDGTLTLDGYNDPDMYKFSEEFVKGIVDKRATEWTTSLRAKAESKARENERAEQITSISKKYSEAKQMRSEAFRELNKIVCSASDFATILSNKKAKELIEKLSLIDAFLNSNFSHQLLTA